MCDDLIWYHVIWNTLSSWLPGDPRGFRNRNHRIHSTGDYKHRPPPTEHKGLHDFNRDQARPEVAIMKDWRPIVSEAVREAAQRREIQISALSVASQHVHGLMRISTDYVEAKRLIGQLKNISSLALRDMCPGSVWSRGTTPKKIVDQNHWEATREYIADKQERGAYVWDVDRGNYWME